MKLTIHRGAHEVGGSCVEISINGSTLLVDFGLPLDYDITCGLSGIFPETIKDLLTRDGLSIDGVLLSHAHLDHYGLSGHLPRGTPVYCGKASRDLMQATVRFSPHKLLLPYLKTFESKEKFHIGPFEITPYLMDHSAFDAYGFLISAGGKRVFYSGDFRTHGRKSKLTDRLPDLLPPVDAMLMEGTLVGNRGSEVHLSESELEEQFVKTIRSTHGIVLVTTSSQNIDRLVTIFRAAKRCGRMFIIDFYTAEILDILKDYANLPNAEWPRIRVCFPRFLAHHFKEEGWEGILDRHRQNGIKWTRINEIRDRTVMLARPGFIPDIKRFVELGGATWIYSMWRGYFERSASLQKLRSFLWDHDVRDEYLHTSGHARIEDMKAFVEKLSPKSLIPIHTFYPDKFINHFQNVIQVSDGQTVEI